MSAIAAKLKFGAVELMSADTIDSFDWPIISAYLLLCIFIAGTIWLMWVLARLDRNISNLSAHCNPVCNALQCNELDPGFGGSNSWGDTVDVKCKMWRCDRLIAGSISGWFGFTRSQNWCIFSLCEEPTQNKEVTPAKGGYLFSNSGSFVTPHLSSMQL